MIDIQGVTLTYPNGTEALRPVSLQLRAGEFVSLLGPSGCGKSTLLKLVAGLLRPSQGQVSVQAKGQEVAFVFQEPTLMPWADVQTNVRLPLDLAQVPRTQADARVAESLKLVGLQDFSRNRPRELSGGMQMRVSIARGLVTRPKLLLMDEPFGALDDITRHKLDADLLALVQAQGLTVLFVTHSISEAAYLSDRVVVMAARPGRVTQVQTVDQTWPRPADVRTSVIFNEVVRKLQHALLTASEAGAT
jgi:NitT/TauT family transport system ATP-binding protein